MRDSRRWEREREGKSCVKSAARRTTRGGGGGGVYLVAGWGVWMEGIDISARVDISRQGHTTTLLHYWCLMDGFYGMGCLGVCGSPSLACLCHNNFLAAHHLSFSNRGNSCTVKIPSDIRGSTVSFLPPDSCPFHTRSIDVVGKMILVVISGISGSFPFHNFGN